MQCEADFQTKFSRWKVYNKKCSALFELKFSKIDNIPFARLEEHQERALLRAKHNQICYKMPDDNFAQKPSDMFCIYKGGGYVVIMYYKKGVKHFYVIDIDDWIKERETSTRKSLTEARASIIGVKYELGKIY